MDSSPHGLRVSTSLPVYVVVGSMIPTFNNNDIDDF